MTRALGLLLLLLAAAGAAAPALAQPAPPEPRRPLGLSVQFAGAVGGGSHYGRGSMSLGLGAAAFVRHGLLLAGGTVDGELYLRGYGTSYLGVLGGVARDLGGRVRLEIVAEGGTHRIEGLGNDFLEATAVAPASVRLPYAGARVGLLGGFPIGGPRVVGGFWLAYRADLRRPEVDVTLADPAGATHVERITAGGRGFAVLARIGVEL